ncbi:uncharacterized protein [Aegilops tauschii subsp. strangulata]|uniref:uncharacterized protein n=1 Tax=Aegilops tauschii subsp. strangulata TaxID=200361 RepID=UPI003CC8CB95
MAMPPGSGHPRASPRAAAVVIFKLVAPSPPRHSPEPPQAVPVAESPAGRLCLDPASSPPAAVTAPCTPLPRAASPPSSDKRRASCLSATPLQLPLQTVASAPSCLLRAHLLLHLRRPHRCAMELLPEPSPSANSVAATTSLIFPGTARFQQTAARWLPPRQVPRPARQRTTSTPFELSRPQAPSTTTALEEFGFDKSDDALVQLGCRDRDRQDRLHGNAKYPYARRRQDRFGIHQVPLLLTQISTKTCTTTVAKFDYRTVTSSSSTKRVHLLPSTRTRSAPNARFEASVSFRSCEDSFDYIRLSSSWTRSSSLRDLRQDDHTLEITSIFAC